MDVSVDSRQDGLGPADGQSDEEYRALSLAALASLGVGLLSPLALVAPFLYAIPALGVAISLVALWKIARASGELIGRSVAIAGLLLSISFGIVAVSSSLFEQALLRVRASRVAESWFEQLTTGAPQAAWQLTQPLSQRTAIETSLAEFYRQHPQHRAAVERYAEEPLIKTLLALGSRGQYRFYQTYAVGGDDSGRVQIAQVYAVSFPDAEGQLTSFFVQIILERLPAGNGQPIYWRIASTEGGFKPPHWDNRHPPRT